MIEIHFTKKDFRVDWFSGKGGGGQHRNKHQNCCRITHKATGMVETGQSHRERTANQRDAFTKLARRIIAVYHINEENNEISDERVRSYHAVRNEVHDHASGLRQQYTHVVEKNNLDDMIDSRRRAMMADENK